MIAGMGSPGTSDPARRGPGRAPLRRRFARRFPDAPSWVGVGLLLAGGVFLADEFGLWRANVVLGFALIGLGVALFRRDLEAARPATPGAGTGTDPRSAAPPARAAPEPGGGSAPPTVGGPADDASIRPIGSADAAPRSRREPSPLGWLTVGTALLAVSTAGMLANLGLVRLPLVSYPATALLVVGAGLMVGAFVGRARWLALPGALLVPAVLAASLVRVPLEGGVGDLVLVARAAGDAAGAHRRAVGSISLDLCRLRGEGTVPVIASTALGDVSVIVPRDAEVRAVAEAGYGAVSIGPRARRGLSVQARRVFPAREGGGGPTIVLDLRTGFGSVWVWRRPAPSRDRGGSPEKGLGGCG
jgi:hypothetical protein